MPWLILAALLTVYIVLGVLYESYIHPITILSTLPSAGVGALLALIITKSELNVIGMIGIILLIGIVKKNAIMMIDFALEAERREGKGPLEGDLSGMPAAISSDHDDDHGRVARRTAASVGNGHRSRIAQASGHHDRRRTDGEPVVDALHHARCLSVSRPPPPLVCPASASIASRRIGKTGVKATRIRMNPHYGERQDRVPEQFV